jgi:hypothetical protein
VLYSPCHFADSWRFSVAPLPSADALCPAPIVAALLNAPEAHLRMSRGKTCVEQAAQYTGKLADEGSVVTRRDTTAPENEEHSSGHTHRKSMCLKEMSAAKQARGQEGGNREKQPAEQKKRTRTTRQATQTQPALLAADGFAAALEAVPDEDWCRTWAACKTIMLRKTSKSVKEVADKVRLPDVVRLSRSFWVDARNGTDKAKRLLVYTRAQCPALPHLDLSGNRSRRGSEDCRSAGTVPGAGAPQSRQQLYRSSRGRESCRSVGAVRSAGSPRPQRESDRLFWGREACRSAASVPITGSPQSQLQ